MQANLHVDRIKFEAAQALSSADAMSTHMSASHEQERVAWYKSAEEYQRRLQDEARQQIVESNTKAGLNSHHVPLETALGLKLRGKKGGGTDAGPGCLWREGVQRGAGCL